MADTLAWMETVNPLDANLESVIPGMHDRFVSMEGNFNHKVGGLSDQVGSLSEQISEFREMVRSHHQDQEKKNEKLAQAYLSMAAILQRKKRQKQDKNDMDSNDDEDFLPGNLNSTPSSNDKKTRQTTAFRFARVPSG